MLMKFYHRLIILLLIYINAGINAGDVLMTLFPAVHVVRAGPMTTRKFIGMDGKRIRWREPMQRRRGQRLEGS